MTQAGATGDAPDSRTRSIWLTQLSLTFSVVVMMVAILIIDPHLFADWQTSVGILLIILITVATLAAPRTWLATDRVIAIPFADALAIAVMAYGSELRFTALWVFPVMWVGMRFTPIALGALLAGIAGVQLVSVSVPGSTDSPLQVVIALLGLTFLGVTVHLAMRAAQAYRRLLGRQAGRLQAALERTSRQEKRMSDLLNGLDTGVARISSSGRILTTNDAYVRLYGLDPHDLAQPARSIEYDTDRGMPLPAAQRPLARAARGEALRGLRVWLYTADGEWRALSISTKREAEDDTQSLIFVHDITDVVLAERERRRLAAIASHELKHPLTAILGYADLALECDELNPRTRDHLSSIQRASERMLRMTSSLLDPAKDQAQAAPRNPLNLRELMRESVESFTVTATSRDIALIFESDEDLPISGDAFRLRQVLDNLISNAIKYTPRGGHVWLSAGLEQDDAVISVTDTGIGIEQRDLASVFTPYFRTREASDSAPGTGLGLAISREIVQDHGGSLIVDSERGVGTIVTVRLPAMNSSTSATTAPPPQHRPAER